MHSSAERIIEKIKTSQTEKIKLAITDIDGVLRGKIIHKQKFLSAIENGFGFCNVVFGWDSADVCYENADYTGWHSGYPDALAKIDLATYRTIPWDSNIPFFLADFYTEKNKPLEICPRQLLKRVRSEALKLGYTPLFSAEYEFFNFKETPDSLHDSQFKSPNPLTPGMFGYSLLRSSLHSDYFNALFDQLGAFQVPLEGLHTETGPGVYEAAILYDDILEAADRAVLFKTAVKEIAQNYGIIPSFMAKWNSNYPGCSGHIHQSLYKDERNCFYDPKMPYKISQTLKHYLAGILHCLPEILPMYAPNINSFKRLVEGAWAPTTCTWGIDNRTTAVRVIPQSEKSTRIEMRVTGSDINAYLAMAACLASGLYGITHKLPLNTEATQGNGYTDKANGSLPKSLHEATDKMKKSDIAKHLFGEPFVSHFVQTREWEIQQASKAVTDWELKRYFEII